MKYAAIREECTEANISLQKSGLVDLTFGNVSVYDANEGVFGIKPSGVPYAELKPEDIVILRLNGEVVEGKLRPSSDTPTHRHLYQVWGDSGVKAVVHTHSRHAVAWAQAGMDIPCLGTTHCDYFYGSVPCTRTMTEAEVSKEYEWDTATVIIEAFQDRVPLDCPAVLVKNHGPFTWGGSAAKAVENAFALEVIAEMAWKAKSLNPSVEAVPPYLLNKHFFRKHGSTAYYGQK